MATNLRAAWEWLRPWERVERPPKAGWRIVAAKEFRDHVTSVRFLILVVILGLTAIAAVYAAASGIRGGVEQSGDVPALFLALFTIQAERNLPPFLFFITLLAPLLGIAFGFDAVNQERAQGTLPRLVSQPIYRDDVVNGKFVAGISSIGLVLVAVTMIVAGVGILRIGVVPSISEILRLIIWLIVSVVYVGFWLGLATLFSVVLRRPATSALSAFAVWLTLNLFAGLMIGIVADVVSPPSNQPNVITQQDIDNERFRRNASFILPGSLYGEATVALMRPERRTFDALGQLLLQVPQVRAVPSVLTLEQSLILVWPQITGLVALTTLVFAAAYVAFMRQEVRA